jgi:hypothetical protein
MSITQKAIKTKKKIANMKKYATICELFRGVVYR